MSTTSLTVPALDAEYAMVIASGAKSVPGMVTLAETGSLAYASSSWTATGTPFASSVATMASIAAFSPGLPDGRTCSAIAAEKVISASVVIASFTDCARTSTSAVVGAGVSAVHAARAARAAAAVRTGFEAGGLFLMLTPLGADPTGCATR